MQPRTTAALLPREMLAFQNQHCDRATDDPFSVASAHWRRKGGKHYMKYLAIIALAVAALSLGACSHKDTSSTTTTHSASTGYSK